MCTSSMMYTFQRLPCGGIRTDSRSSRISSTLLLDAASISKIDRLRPSSNARHESHFRQGSTPSFRSPAGAVQLIAFASMRAAVVLPTPPAYLRRRSTARSEEHTSELQSRGHLVCRLLL